jgi:hypothetical protein
MSTRIQALEARVVAAAAAVVERLRPAFERQFCGHIALDDPDREAKVLKRLTATPLGEAMEPLNHFQRFYKYLPYFAGVEHVFEIGVGTGSLFTLLEDVVGIRVDGVDAKSEKATVRSEFRRALAIDQRVVDHRIVAWEPLPFPDGVECVAAFWATFNKDWGVDEHAWFLEECRRRLVGARLVMLRFKPGAELDSYLRRFAVRPLVYDTHFRIIAL